MIQVLRIFEASGDFHFQHGVGMGGKRVAQSVLLSSRRPLYRFHQGRFEAVLGLDIRGIHLGNVNRTGELPIFKLDFGFYLLIPMAIDDV
jgi:hypothetical protein